MKLDREASLTEVLSEASILDAWAVVKSVFLQWGCLGLFVVISTIIANGSELLTGSDITPEIPGWLLWMLVIWIYLSALTEYKSYHAIEWYFPKLGWIRSIPLALYLTIGVWIFGYSEFQNQLAKGLVVLCWTTPLILGFSILDIGYRRLMIKRAHLANNAPQEG